MTLDMQKVAIEFLAQQDAWNSLPEVYDDKLDSDIHAMYVNPPKTFRSGVRNTLHRHQAEYRRWKCG